MVLDEAVIGGAFALAGVGIQQAFTVASDRRRARADRARALLDQRVNLYTQVITAARRVQRALKDSSTGRGDRTSTEARLARELEQLAESVAAMRLFTSPQTSSALERFEEKARDLYHRPPDERAEPDEDLRLGPMIRSLQDELSRTELGADDMRALV